MLEGISSSLFDLCFAAFVIEASAIIWAIIRYFRYKHAQIFTPIVILITGTLLSAIILFLKSGENILVAVHTAIRLFIVDFDLGDFFSRAHEPELSYTYIFIGHLSVFAPLLTFTVVLSFLYDILSHIELCFYIFHDKYIFSELNEKSIALAESIYKEKHNNTRKQWIKMIFTGVQAESGETQNELMARAKAIRAICFRKDISCMDLRFDKGKIRFFAIKEDSAENVKSAAGIRELYGNRAKTRLYIFASSVEAEMFVSSQKDEKIEIRCINEVCSVVYRTLYNMEINKIRYGEPDLFSGAVSDGVFKNISAVIVGMEQYGIEMLKALTWFGQMDGYKLKIDAFDIGTDAEKYLKANCPEIMDEKHNRKFAADDAYYDITIHSDTNVKSDQFYDEIKTLGNVTYVLVALGTDEDNIAAAAQLRMMFERNNVHPIIHAVVFDSDKVKLLAECRNFKGQKYDINYVGDLATIYSHNVILKSDLEAEALKVQMKYNASGDFEKIKKDFYSYEYNYRSSMTSAIHLKARIACGLQGEGVAEDERALSILEHKRWNAYMRTEGYVYSGSLDKASRNDLAKTHNYLVGFESLPLSEKEKDRRISMEDVK